MRCVVLAAVLALATPVVAAAQVKYERNDKGEWTYERKDGRTFLKEEQKRDQ